MSRVYISIGSNIDRYRHVTSALDALADWFGELSVSPVYESESVGFEGSDFRTWWWGSIPSCHRESCPGVSNSWRQKRPCRRPQIQSPDAGPGYPDLR